MRTPFRKTILPGRGQRASSAAVRSAVGISSRRSSGIAKPLSTEMPYVPAARRASARSTAASSSRWSFCKPSVELVLVQVGREIHRVLIVRFLARVLMTEPRESSFDSPALGGQQLAGSLGVHLIRRYQRLRDLVASLRATSMPTKGLRIAVRRRRTRRCRAALPEPGCVAPRLGRAARAMRPYRRPPVRRRLSRRAKSRS